VAERASPSGQPLNRGWGSPPYSLTYGSGTLVRTLLQHGLIDELVLGVHPVVLGAGTRLFDLGLANPLRLVDATPTATGVVALTYAP
jgi:dihydrofolate reductase